MNFQIPRKTTGYQNKRGRGGGGNYQTHGGGHNNQYGDLRNQDN